jgi:hypothetical protein
MIQTLIKEDEIELKISTVLEILEKNIVEHII